MIFSVLSYLLVVSAIVSVTAWIAEHALRRLGRPTRGTWLVAMASVPLLLSAPTFAPFGRTAIGRALDTAPVFSLPPLVLQPTAADGGSGTVVVMALGVWLVLSLGLAGALVGAHRRLLRRRTSWDTRVVGGARVYVSPDLGPAVAGVLRAWIVVPAWTLTLPAGDQRLIVLHEQEHVEARDALLLAVGLFFLVLTPWNPLTWWQLRRLRTSVEVDCDRRVLRVEPDRERYGNSLLTVAARYSGSAMALAAFSERPHSLKHRIVAMTQKPSKWTPLQATLLVLLALAVGVQACGLESPMRSGAGQDDPVRTDVVLATADRVSVVDAEATPYSVAPVLSNADEVIEALDLHYPAHLREMTIGGTVQIYAYVLEDGSVSDVRIDESSGNQAIDDAALQVSFVLEYEPATRDGEPVPVWIKVPITFTLR